MSHIIDFTTSECTRIDNAIALSSTYVVLSQIDCGAGDIIVGRCRVESTSNVNGGVAIALSRTPNSSGIFDYQNVTASSGSSLIVTWQQDNTPSETGKVYLLSNCSLTSGTAEARQYGLLRLRNFAK